MSSTSSMTAVHYEKLLQGCLREISVRKIGHPDDLILKVTTASMLIITTNEVEVADGLLPAICGSDMHMYQAGTAVENGLVFGEIPVEAAHANACIHPIEALQSELDDQTAISSISIPCCGMSGAWWEKRGKGGTEYGTGAMYHGDKGHWGNWWSTNGA